MIRLMKKLTYIFALILTFSLIGCSSTSNVSKSETNEEKIKVEEKQSNVDTKLDEKSDSHNTTEEKKVEEKEIKTDTTDSTNNQTQTTLKNEQSINSSTNVSSPKAQSSTTVKPTTKENQTNKKPSETTKQPKTVIKKQPPQASTVSITIIGPKDIGIVLGKTNISFKDGDTVLDILLMATGKKIFVDYSGSGAMAYVSGIDDVYEFDYGPKSGWTAKLNGSTLNKSSGIVKVKKDDQMEWIYSEDYSEE
ncbi:DUF4430 domain-containing protein [Bacillus sp. CGMCC 1.16607]|uniref:DUF4430 domain-containing protein n=1 Tax=Bacillus sp. CGMCC 1.16607 TaxID=3351842 RepID=UPI0036363FFC